MSDAGLEPSVDEIRSYVSSMLDACRRRLARGTGLPFLEVDEVASTMAEVFLLRPAEIMRSYPDPEAYVGASLASRILDLRRRERAQRGQGARAREGGERPGRMVVSLDEQPTLSERTDHGEDDMTVARVDLVQLLQRVPPEDRWLLLFVDYGGRSIKEAADLLGVDRSVASRRRRRILDVVRRELEAEERTA